MQLRPLGKTGLATAPVVFGGNVRLDRSTKRPASTCSTAGLDAGFNAVDTADSYSHWAEGNCGGESETIIGNWLKANPSKRDKLLIFTKVGSVQDGEVKGLSARWIAEGVERSLKRLRTDRTDLYFAHKPDPNTPFAETSKPSTG